MTRKGRRLSPEEERLWQKITDTANPLDARPSKSVIQVKPKKTEQSSSPPEIPTFRVGENAAAPNTSTRVVLPDQPLRMDRKTFAKMTRGKTNPDARIDLHGMTVDVAHSALRAFLLRSHAEGKRLVLVITGKGRQADPSGFGQTMGILRRQVPHWLDQPPLRQIVLQTTPAHQKHGGSGALYVYLRR